MISAPDNSAAPQCYRKRRSPPTSEPSASEPRSSTRSRKSRTRSCGSRADTAALAPLTRAVTERVVHASADFDYLTDLVCVEEALAAGAAALRRGAPVVADSVMVVGRHHQPRGRVPGTRSAGPVARHAGRDHPLRRGDARRLPGCGPRRRVGDRHRPHGPVRAAGPWTPRPRWSSACRSGSWGRRRPRPRCGPAGSPAVTNQSEQGRGRGGRRRAQRPAVPRGGPGDGGTSRGADRSVADHRARYPRRHRRGAIPPADRAGP